MDNDQRVNTRTSQRNPSWAWVLLLPLFFILGWFTNDAVSQSGTYTAEPGVGGAPFVNERETPTPTIEPTPREVISPEPTTTPDDADVSPKPTVSPDDSLLN